MEGERRSPILREEVGRTNAGRRDEGVEIANVIVEAIVDIRLAGLAEADQIRGYASRHRRDKRQDIAPNVGRRRIAVQKEREGRSRSAHLTIGHGGIEHGSLWQGEVCDHGHGSLKTVEKAIRLKRSRGSVLRVTFMRRIAPSQEASRKSASSSGAKVPAISPMAWASAMQAAKGARHSVKMAARRSRSMSLRGAASRLKSPIRQPRVKSSASRRSVMISR